MQLPLPASGSITEIIHLADTHIRLGDRVKSRYDEYMGVFAQLIADLKLRPAIQSESAVVVIAGDVFDTKYHIETLAVEMFHFLVHSLSTLAPVYIIQGNHDYMQAKPDIPDLLTSMLRFNTNPRIVYLTETGTYVAGDVVFGLVAIREALLAGATSGIVETLPAFPQPDSETPWRLKAALFHGTIAGTKMNETRIAPKGYPLDWFEGYDIGLFGDIHKQQINGAVMAANGVSWDGKRIAWGYPGSLIQQNYGETLYNHGYLVWNIDTRTITAHHVKNEYGMCYLRALPSGLIQVDELKEELSSAIKNKRIPANISYRIIGDTNMSRASIDRASQALIAGGIHAHLEFTSADTKSTEVYDFTPNVRKEELVVDAASFVDFVNAHPKRQSLPIGFEWEEFIMRDLMKLVNDLPKDDVTKKYIDDRIKSIRESARILTQCQEPQIKQRFTIMHLSWAYLLAYGEGCYIDFATLQNHVCLINGPNNSGKSSIMEIILLAIYGESMSSRNDKNAAEVINKNRPDRVKASVSIQFALGDTVYAIRSSFSKKEVGESANARRQRDVTLYCVVDGNLQSVHAGANVVNKWVEDNIGKKDTFLRSCILTQSADSDFFKLSHDDQKTELVGAFNMRYVEALNSFLGDMHTIYEYVARNLRTRKSTLTASITKEQNAESILRQYAIVEESTETAPLAELEEQLAAIKDLVTKCNDRYINSIAQSAAYGVRSSDVSKYTIGDLESQLFEARSTAAIPVDRNFLDDIYEDMDAETPNLLAKIQSAKSKLAHLESLYKLRFVSDISSYDEYIDWKNKPRHAIKETVCPVKESELFAILADLNDWLSANESANVDQSQLIANRDNAHETYVNCQAQMVAHSMSKPALSFGDTHRAYDSCIKDIAQYADTIQQFTDECAAITCVAPSYSEDELKIAETQIANVRGLYPTEWLNASESEFADIISRTESALKDTTPADMGAIHARLAFNETPVSKKRAEYECDLQEANPQDCTQISTLLQLLSETRKSQSEIAERLARYKEVAVNPTCDACKSHPWNVERAELVADFNRQTLTIETLANAIRALLPIAHQTDDIETAARIYIIEMQIAKARYESAVVGLMYWTKYEDKLIAEHELAEEEMRVKNVHLLESLRGCAGARPLYRDLIVRVETQRDAHRRYALQTKQRELYERLKSLESAMQWHNEYQRLNSELKNAERESQLAIADLEASTRLLSEIADKQQLRQRINEWIAHINQVFENECVSYAVAVVQDKAVRAHMQKIENERLSAINVKRVEYLIKIREIYEELEDLKTQQNAINARNITKLKETHRDDALRKGIAVEALECINHLDEIEKTMMGVTCLQEMHAEYKGWIFENIILPRVTDQVNELLRVMLGGDTPYQLRAVLKNGAIFWKEFNGNCDASLSKVGGFHYAMISFLFRIVMQYIGHGSKIQNTQLLLDEAFVAADSDNLARIPEFIHKLVSQHRMFETILLMSHQEVLREGCSMSIDITRSADNLFSKICYGSIVAANALAITHQPAQSNAPAITTPNVEPIAHVPAIPSAICVPPPVAITGTGKVRCAAITGKGSQCKNPATWGIHCGLHSSKSK